MSEHSTRSNLELHLAVALDELVRRREEARFMSYLAKPRASQKQINAWLSGARGRVVIGGNRSGKSMFGAVESVTWCHHSTISASGGHATPLGRAIPRGPVYVRVVCPELPSTLDKPHVQRDKVRLITPAHWLRGDNWHRAYSVLGHTLHFKNGSLLEFMSSEQSTDKHSGQSLHAVWFDEEMPKQIWTENMARLDQGSGAWWLTYTPVQALRWIYDDIYLPALRGKYFMVEIDTEDNRHNLGSEFIEEMDSALSESEKEMRLRGRYSVQSGLVYDVFGSAHTGVSVEVVG